MTTDNWQEPTHPSKKSAIDEIDKLIGEPLDLDAIEGDILEYTSADIDETTWEEYIKPQISALVAEVKRLRAELDAANYDYSHTVQE